jgi:hypothetical protein
MVFFYAARHDIGGKPPVLTIKERQHQPDHDQRQRGG